MLLGFPLYFSPSRFLSQKGGVTFITVCGRLIDGYCVLLHQGREPLQDECSSRCHIRLKEGVDYPKPISKANLEMLTTGRRERKFIKSKETLILTTQQLFINYGYPID